MSDDREQPDKILKCYEARYIYARDPATGYVAEPVKLLGRIRIEFDNADDLPQIIKEFTESLDNGSFVNPDNYKRKP